MGSANPDTPRAETPHSPGPTGGQDSQAPPTPIVVGSEKTMQLAVLCLTFIASLVIAVGAYTGSVDDTVVVGAVSAIAGLLGGQAIRRT